MSQQHAGGTPDQPAALSAREGASPAVPPAPRDERPRPQYGEYAPEGWTWEPPQDDRYAPATTPERASVAPPAAAASVTDRPDRAADRIITVLLLVIGIFGAWTAVGTIQAIPDQLPQAIRQAGELLGTPAAAVDYTPGPEVPGILLAGSIAQVVLWLLTAWWSVARLRARKLAFWVPLVGGFVSFVLLYAVMFVVIAMDPELVSSLSGG
ncbi:DUF6264 family protein [Agromyces sp. Marseille-P2726]|uniref:DUF6264 family protein n=1 Tax=Agromyces sp. Marseille-P2726 TaxID=2709132 RepID=UPI00156E1165|nr:DUF6264 family protein [Agromyces sp. Marseille-P2726]